MTTMRDVAQKAGVSSTTVSFVLSGRQPAGGPISEETRARVLTIARELGYRRNGLAQAVVSGHNRTLGFLSRQIIHEFASRILTGTIQEARQAGYGVHVMLMPDNSVNKQAVESCLEMRLAGIITLDMNQESLDYLHSEMRPRGVPIAFLDTSFEQDWGIHITGDDEQGCHLAIQHLVELGHKRIAFIGGELGRGMAISRARYYREAMSKHGLEVRDGFVQYGQWRPKIAQQCTLEMLNLPSPPTAILCASDEMAIGAQTAARQFGLQLPRDLSVIGFSDLSVSELGQPPLTTVWQPKSEMGQAAVRSLLEQIARNSAKQNSNTLIDEATSIRLPTQLTVRDSTTTAPTV